MGGTSGTRFRPATSGEPCFEPGLWAPRSRLPREGEYLDVRISEDMTDPEPLRLDREHLYEEAWSEPMARLAKHYGISDVALAKICREMDIPVAPRGYWRRLEKGYRRALPAW